jgi:hydrogenase/urease accessory protein HupE
MKLIPRRLVFWSFIFLLISALTAQAHDPGLSSATITVGNRRIDLLLGFAQRDVESVLATFGGQSEIQSREGFGAVRSQLESLAARETSLHLEDAPAVPNQTVAKRKDRQNIEILLSFSRTSGSRLVLVSKLIERLPFGHREFVSIKTDNGVTLGEAILSRNANSFQIGLPAARSIASANGSPSFFAFLLLGVEHILTGYDHLLFLFGLLIVCRDARSILTVISCFTIAHSITLALATLGVVRLPASVVEPLIAATIVYVSFENLMRGDAAKWRWLITFSFGLVHGLGFADALREFGIGSGRFGIILPLVGFNLGVEIGQLSVAAVVLPIFWQIGKNPGLMRQWASVCSAAVTVAGSYWLLERILQQ